MVSATTVYRNGPANDPGYPEILLSDEPIVPHDGYKPQPNAPAWRDQCPSLARPMPALYPLRTLHLHLRPRAHADHPRR